MTEKMTIEQYKEVILGKNGKPKKNETHKGDANKAKIGWLLIDISRRRGLFLRTEYRFHHERQWEADWAMFGTWQGHEVKIIVEYEGVFSEKSRHTTIKGYTGDADKYNAAGLLGWLPLRYTSLNFQRLGRDLDQYFKTLSKKQEDGQSS